METDSINIRQELADMRRMLAGYLNSEGMRRIVLIACLFGIVLQFWRLANIQETYSPNDSIMEMKVTKEVVMLLMFFLGLVVTGRSLNKEDE